MQITEKYFVVLFLLTSIERCDKEGEGDIAHDNLILAHQASAPRIHRRLTRRLYLNECGTGDSGHREPELIIRALCFYQKNLHGIKFISYLNFE